jgi:hypothetical protein
MARLGILEDIGAVLSAFGPAWFRRLIVNLIPLPAVQEFKNIVDTLHKVSTNFFEHRKQLLDQGNVADAGREDLLNLLGK